MKKRLFVLSIITFLIIPLWPNTGEKELINLYLDVVEEAVIAFEPLWRDDSKRIPNSGFFDVRLYDDWTPSYPGYAGIVTIPLNGLVDFCYAVLLTETEKPFFTRKKIPRSTLLDHAIKSIRWCCLTSVYVKNPYPYIYKDTAPQFLEAQYWRREFGYRADEVGFLTLAAAILWDKLDEETKQLVEEVMIGVAPKERLVRTWEPPQGGNHDQVKQDMSSTIGAAFLFPWRPDQKMYWDIVAQNGIDLVSTVHDFARKVVVEGQPLQDLARGWNLYPDYTSDHHGWAQMWYGSDMIFEGYFYVDIFSHIFGRPMPETFTYPGNGFEGILERMKVLCLPEGEPVSVHGMEYDSYYGSGLLAYVYGSLLKKDAVASALEERAARLLKRHSRALPIYDYHRNNHAKAALAYLAHKYGGNRAEPLAFPEAWQALAGTFHHPWWQNIFHRDRRKVSSFSWGTISSSGEHFGGDGSGVCGYVVPARLDKMEPEPLVYLHPFSMVGESTVEDETGKKFKGPSPRSFYRLARTDVQFHTAGRVCIGPVEQRMAFFSFPDGPCLFLNLFMANDAARLDWSGIPVYFYRRPGMTSSRQYVDATGKRALESPFHGSSSWWCVDNSIGAAFLGGSGEVEVQSTVGRNWARTDAYKDKCDAVLFSPLRGVNLKPKQVEGDIAAVFFPETEPSSVGRALQSMKKNQLDIPTGWRGVIIEEERGKIPRRHLAIANLGGQTDSTSLHLSFEAGAPVTSLPSLVRGRSGWFSLRLEPFESFSETVTAYAEVLNNAAVEFVRPALGRYIIRPTPRLRARIRLTFCEPIATLKILDRTGKNLQEIAPSENQKEEGIVLEVDQEVELWNEKEMEADIFPPAVEISRLTVREDGRVRLDIDAHDQSGIKAVEIFIDGNRVAKVDRPPWTWSGWPGKGYHTFSAQAKDASVRANVGRSFSRTVEIHR